MRNFGLINFKNNCYINSVLQLLILIKPLQKYFSKNDFLYITDNKLVRDFVNILRLKLIQSDIKRYKPLTITQEIYKSLNIPENEQFDAHEFLLLFINYIHENMKIPFINNKIENNKNKFWMENNKNDFSIIKKNLYGQIENTFKCNCGINKTRELFFDLIIFNSTSFLKSVDNFFNSKFTCSICNDNKYIEKKIEKIPKYLFFVISKFDNGLKKNNQILENIKSIINMKKYTKTEKDKIFKLKGFVNHIGSLNSGHYFTNIIDEKNNILIDDELVKNIENIDTKYSYILMYERI